MNPPDSAAGEPGPDVPEPALPAAAALSLTRRYVMPPLVLSLVVSIAAVTSFLVLAMPLEGEVGEAPEPVVRSLSGECVQCSDRGRFPGCGAVRRRFRISAWRSTVIACVFWMCRRGPPPRPGSRYSPDDRFFRVSSPTTGRPRSTTTRTPQEERYGLTRRRYVDQGLAPLRFIVWVLPMLGFIGTVVGISGSITGLESVIGSDGGGQAAAGLITVLEGLRFAFDTTLLGLGTVIPVMALLTILERREDALTGKGCDRGAGPAGRGGDGPGRRRSGHHAPGS